MPITPCPIPCAPCSPPIGGQNGAAAHLGLNPLDPNNPFVNLSSEVPDADLFIGINNQPPIIGQPPLGDTWYAAGCLGFCFSNTSQEDADACAAAQAVLCVAPNWPPPPGDGPPPNPGDPPLPPEPRPVFYNDIQFCSFTCPDGSLFTFTVAAGFMVAFNKATANAMAYAYACQRAVQNRLCPGNLSNSSGCIGAAFSSLFAASSGNQPVTYNVVAGSVPPGVLLSQSTPTQQVPSTVLIFSGTPTAVGDYPFTVQATDSIGGVIQKTFIISIYGIITGSELDDATLNSAYSTTFTPSPNLTGALTYSIVGGSLPDGLTLNSSTGEISGTPTVDGAYQINVRVSNGTVSCNKVFDLFVDSAGPCELFYRNIVWDPVNASGTSASGTTNLNVATANVETFVNGDFSQVIITGSISYQGPAFQCRLRIDYANYIDTNGNIGGSNDVLQDGNPILNFVDSGNTGPDSGFLNFSVDVADSPAPSLITIQFLLQCVTDPVQFGPGRIHDTFTFGDFP